MTTGLHIRSSSTEDQCAEYVEITRGSRSVLTIVTGSPRSYEVTPKANRFRSGRSPSGLPAQEISGSAPLFPHRKRRRPRDISMIRLLIVSFPLGDRIQSWRRPQPATMIVDVADSRARRSGAASPSQTEPPARSATPFGRTAASRFRAAAHRTTRSPYRKKGSATRSATTRAPFGQTATLKVTSWSGRERGHHGLRTAEELRAMRRSGELDTAEIDETRFSGAKSAICRSSTPRSQGKGTGDCS